MRLFSLLSSILSLFYLQKGSFPRVIICFSLLSASLLLWLGFMMSPTKVSTRSDKEEIQSRLGNISSSSRSSGFFPAEVGNTVNDENSGSSSPKKQNEETKKDKKVTFINEGVLPCFAIPAYEHGWDLSEKSRSCKKASGYFLSLGLLCWLWYSQIWIVINRYLTCRQKTWVTHNVHRIGKQIIGKNRMNSRLIRGGKSGIKRGSDDNYGSSSDDFEMDDHFQMVRNPTALFAGNTTSSIFSLEENMNGNPNMQAVADVGVYMFSSGEIKRGGFVKDDIFNDSKWDRPGTVSRELSDTRVRNIKKCEEEEMDAFFGSQETDHSGQVSPCLPVLRNSKKSSFNRIMKPLAGP